MGIRGWGLGLGRKIAQLAQAGSLVIADNDMIEDVDLEKLASADQVTGDFDVTVRGRGFAAGMVMQENQRGGTGQNGDAKNFAGMNQQIIGGALGHDLKAFDTAARVEKEDGEILNFGIKAGLVGDSRLPKLDGLFGRIGQHHVSGQRLLAERHQGQFFSGGEFHRRKG